MSSIVYDGNYFVYWLPACADISAPTVAEIAAGKKWSQAIQGGDMSLPSNQSTFDNSSIESNFDAEGVGTWGGSIEINLKRDTASEADTFDFVTYGLAGFILISPFEAAVATSKVMVYPAEAHEPIPMSPTKNERQKIKCKFACTSAPDQRAVVAA